MTVRAARRVTVVASALVALASGPAAAGTATTEPPAGSTAPAAGCAEITGALDAVDAFATSVFAGQSEAAKPLLTAIPELGATAAAAAPPEIVDAVATWVEPFPDIAAALASADLSDLETMNEALSGIDTEASDSARAEVAGWASDNCGWVSAADLAPPEVAEPADCESLDAAAAAADAAAVEVDVADLDGSADVNLPGLWTKSCSYGNGAMSLSTLSFAAVEDAQRFYADNLDAVDGVVLDVAVGSLPASSLVIQTGSAAGAGSGSSVPSSEAPAATTPATVQVAVFEAPVPFSVTFTGADVDPAAVVAAAEAVLAALGTEAPASTAAEAPTTS